MILNTYDIGDVVRLTASFTDPSTGDPVQPGAVSCTVEPPESSSTQSPEVSEPSPGVFEALAEPDVAGTWRYAFDGSAPAKASEEGAFNVRPRKVPR